MAPLKRGSDTAARTHYLIGVLVYRSSKLGMRRNLEADHGSGNHKPSLKPKHFQADLNAGGEGMRERRRPMPLVTQ